MYGSKRRIPAVKKGRPRMAVQKKWHDGMYVTAFLLAKSGSPDKHIGDSLGVHPSVFEDWKRKKPYLKEALDRGRAARTETFRDFVYGRLPPELKELWDRINLCESSPSGVERAEALLERQGLYARQHLFLYALVDSNFNPSEACRKVNTCKDTVDHWIGSDQRFARLMDEIKWHKGNFFENALMEKVAGGDAPAIIFANKTFNKARGYGEKIDVSVTSTVKVEHKIQNEVTIRLDAVPLEARKQILCILEESERATKLLPVKSEVLSDG